MLIITDAKDRLNRRAFLTAGALGLGGLHLTSLLSGKASAQSPASHITGRSVIFLFQQGGPSQFETFDPKPDAPDGIRTVGETIPTALASIRFGHTLPRLAKLAEKLIIVRSFQTNNAGHNIQPIVGPDSLEANIGSLYSRVAGATRPESSMPTNTVLFPQAVCTDVAKGSARGNISATGSLGVASAPFIPGEGGQLQKNLRLNMPQKTLKDRQALLNEFDRLGRQVEAASDAKAIDDTQEQALRVLLSGAVAEAFDLSREDPKTIAKYDTASYVRPDGWSKAARGRRGYYTGTAHAIGKQLLLARRLCEAGCGYVTVHSGYEGVWDMHADGNNLNMRDGMEAVGPSFDHAVAAFIEDIESRGLRDKIMLVCCGEMGRTPRVNKNGGRDHWARLAPLLIYGGGLSGGQVIGASNRDGGEPASENLTPKHLISTILHSLFDVGKLRLMSGLEPIARLAEHSPIPGLE